MASLIPLFAVASLVIQVDSRRYSGWSGHYNHKYKLANIEQIQDCEYTYPTLATDTCGTIAAQNVMTLPSFQALNPHIKCGDGVYVEANQLVCVPNAVNGTAVNKSVPNLPSSNITAISFACSFDVVLQKGDSCDSVAALFNVSATDRFYLNQFLNCEDTVAFAGKPLCLSGTFNTTTGSISLGGPKNVTLNAPIPSASCNSTVIAGNNQTCADVSKANNITITQLGAWNKGVDCWNVGEGNAVCVADSVAIPTTTTSTTTTITLTPATQTNDSVLSASPIESTQVQPSPVQPSPVQPSPEPSPPPKPSPSPPPPPPVCVPNTRCSDSQCGMTIFDNCGNPLSCPACPCVSNTVCSSNQCGQTITDNCGNQIRCQDCPPPPPPSQDPCSVIIGISNEYGGSNSPQAALDMHNRIRSYVNSIRGSDLAMLSWLPALESQAYADAVYSVNHSVCQNGELVHNPDFGSARAKSLGWTDYTSAIRSFIAYNNGGGSECFQYFNNGVTSSHFGFMVGRFSQLGCSIANCPDGRFGGVVGCDYA
ncbi:UNVERIFIED_CONTAM: hypothetical protein HDU68_001336 [Siphonaria sp. JEL0065]|nr:hypothetical protein HDU68_001336 [Siphonaria sp. JEL0065]